MLFLIKHSFSKTLKNYFKSFANCDTLANRNKSFSHQNKHINHLIPHTLSGLISPSLDGRPTVIVPNLHLLPYLTTPSNNTSRGPLWAGRPSSGRKGGAGKAAVYWFLTKHHDLVARVTQSAQSKMAPSLETSTLLKKRLWIVIFLFQPKKSYACSKAKCQEDFFFFDVNRLAYR